MSVSIAVLATLDTKGAEARFVCDQIGALGHVAIPLDLSLVRGEIDDSTRDLLPEAKHAAMLRVVEHVSADLLALIDSGHVDGLIGMGGGQGTWLVAEVSKRLPLEFPKVLVTTLATRAGSYLEGTDVTIVPSITDIAGLNSLLRGVLERASGAIVGAAQQRSRGGARVSALTSITMFGVTTRGGTALKAALEERALDVAVFHANGNGGSLMEDLVRSGVISGVLDWTTTELADDLLGGIATAGPNRLVAAGREGVPQLIVPGALDVVNFGPIDSVPARFRSRVLHRHTPAATLMRTSAEDMVELARRMAAKLNAARGPVAVVVPEAGFSALSVRGGPFHNPQADRAWIDSMQAELDPSIPLTVLPLDINDPAFASEVAQHYVQLSRISPIP